MIGQSPVDGVYSPACTTYEDWKIDADHFGAVYDAEFRMGWDSLSQQLLFKVIGGRRTPFNGGIDYTGVAGNVCPAMPLDPAPLIAANIGAPTCAPLPCDPANWTVLKVWFYEYACVRVLVCLGIMWCAMYRVVHDPCLLCYLD